jgi:hypothetical protein
MPQTPIGILCLGAAAIFMGLAVLSATFNDMHSADLAQRTGLMIISSALFAIASGLWK